MYEELLENIAQANGLREVNTYIKVVIGLGVYRTMPAFHKFYCPAFHRNPSIYCNYCSCTCGCEDVRRPFHCTVMVCRDERDRNNFSVRWE